MITLDHQERRRGCGATKNRALGALMGMVMAIAMSTHMGVSAQQQITGFTPESSEIQARYEEQFIGVMEPGRIIDHHEFMARGPAEDATPGGRRRVRYIKSELESYGFDPEIVTLYPYMADSRAVRVSVDMVSPIRLSLPVKEDPQPWQERFDEVSVGFNEGTPPADITAEVVYANYGRPEDYQFLKERGVSVEGKIVLVRLGGTQRSEKPYQAYINNVAGLIMYNDPISDGYVRGTVYPDGPWRAPQCIERGTIYRWSLYAGDPLTPGWAATKHAPRIPVEESNMGKIPPTTTIGYGAAQQIFEKLTGPAAPDEWQGGFPFDYLLGGPGSPTVHLQIDIEYAPRPSETVVIRIPGSERPDEMVVIGSHWDTWAYGTTDNTSGPAMLLEVARGLRTLVDLGWQPKRTLLVAFFGAEDRGITGATEFAEQMGAGVDRIVAFINPAHIVGPTFRANVMPSLDEFIFDATRRVEWGGTGRTIYQSWSGDAGEPSVGRRSVGDAMSWLYRFGAPVMSIGASSEGSRYHSACDDFRSVRIFDDPELLYQTSMAKLNGLIVMRLGSSDLLPFRYSSYAEEVAGYLRELEDVQRAELGRVAIGLDRHIEQAAEWAEAAREFEAEANKLLASNGGPSDFSRMNGALMKVERSFLIHRGLPGRFWYRHQIYATELTNGFALAKLPGIRDALFLSEDFDEAARYASDLLDSLHEATTIFQEAIRPVATTLQ
jgi:N-acetylated-alpha-linked acidic dipeptidase